MQTQRHLPVKNNAVHHKNLLFMVNYVMLLTIIIFSNSISRLLLIGVINPDYLD